MNKTIQGNWYEPLNYLKSLKSTIKADFINACSSAGNWSGYVVKKIGLKFGLFAFSQENRFPKGGYELYLDTKPIAKFKEIPSDDDICDIFDIFNN